MVDPDVARLRDRDFLFSLLEILQYWPEIQKKYKAGRSASSSHCFSCQTRASAKISRDFKLQTRGFSPIPHAVVNSDRLIPIGPLSDEANA